MAYAVRVAGRDVRSSMWMGPLHGGLRYLGHLSDWSPIGDEGLSVAGMAFASIRAARCCARGMTDHGSPGYQRQFLWVILIPPTGAGLYGMIVRRQRAVWLA